jgi:hypothetical protein
MIINCLYPPIYDIFKKINSNKVETSGAKCYDHYFQLLFANIRHKISVFLKNQCYGPFLRNLGMFIVKNTFYFDIFW